MNLSLVAGAVIFPVLLWATYHYYHDRHRPEPVINLIIALALGVLASFLAGSGYQALGFIGLRYDAELLAVSNLPGLFLYSVLGIGMIEESAKLLPFLLVVLRFRDFDEPADGIVYASFIALGFAVTENYHYLDHLSAADAAARGFAAPVVHIVFASLWGYHLGVARLAGNNLFPATSVWLLGAAMLHGVYDFIVLAFGGGPLAVAACLIMLIWVWRLRLLLRLQGAAAELGGSDRPQLRR